MLGLIQAMHLAGSPALISRLTQQMAVASIMTMKRSPISRHVFSGFQVGASYVPQANQDVDGFNGANSANSADGIRDDSFAVAANFKRAFGDIKVQASAGYQDFGDDDAVVGELESYQFGLRLGFGGFGIAGTYGENDRAVGSRMETIGVGVNYAAGPVGVSLGYIGSENDDISDDQDVIELGAKYKLGPGVEARGSVYYAERRVAGTDQIGRASCRERV